MLLDAKTIHGDARGSQVGVCLGVDRIVGVTEIVNHPSVQVEVGTGHERQILVDGKLVVISQVPIYQKGEFASCSGLVLCQGYICLEKALAGYFSVHV